MKYVSYFFNWGATVLSVSFFYKMFWDIFYSVWFQKEEKLIYGFDPAGLPEFNWKINLFLWLSGIVLMAISLGLIMDGVCKKHFQKNSTVPLWVVIANQSAAFIGYLLLAFKTEFYERLYYMPLFFSEIIRDIFKDSSLVLLKSDVDLYSTVVHVLIFSVTSMWFYIKERRRQLYIKERERIFRQERELQNNV